MKSWKLLCIFIVSFAYLPSSLAMGHSPEGRWITIDDKTGEKRAVVKLALSGSTLNGRIVKVYPQKGDTGICSKCPGQFKDKPIKGIAFIWGLTKEKDHDVWSGGSILDPKTGKIYRAKVSFNHSKLNVRGYIGISAIGRTQTWIR